MSEVEVSAKIKVKIGDNTLKLTLEEAKDLRAQLNEVLGDEFQYYPPVSAPTIWPEQPIPVTYGVCRMDEASKLTYTQ